jgi:hypothetical protein
MMMMTTMMMMMMAVVVLTLKLCPIFSTDSNDCFYYEENETGTAYRWLPPQKSAITK